MSTYFIIVVPFSVLALVFLFLGIRNHNRVFLPLGLSFMLTAIINAVVGFSVGN